MKFILKWFISAGAVLLAAYLLPGIEVASLYIALIVAIILGFMNTFVRPLLVLLTLPINILTLGLFIFVLNGLLFWFVSSFIEGFHVSGFLAAVLGSFIVSIFSSFGEKVLINNEEDFS